MLKFGLITQAGSWFTFIDPESGEILDGFKAQGMPKVVELLKIILNCLTFILLILIII